MAYLFRPCGNIKNKEPEVNEYVLCAPIIYLFNDHRHIALFLITIMQVKTKIPCLFNAVSSGVGKFVKTFGTNSVTGASANLAKLQAGWRFTRELEPVFRKSR